MPRIELGPEYTGKRIMEYLDRINPDNDPDSSKMDKIRYNEKKFVLNNFLLAMQITDDELRMRNSNERLGLKLDLKRKKPAFERPPEPPESVYRGVTHRSL
jgi:hypothetical protein